jgi:predicted DNA-binding protein (UPF0251 family)
MTIADELSFAIGRRLEPAEIEMLYAVREKHKRELSYQAAAARLGISWRTVMRYISEGKLVKSRRGHVTRASLDALLLVCAARIEKHDP